MIENKVIEKLEFKKVLEFISSYSYTNNGKEKILNTKPFKEIMEIEEAGKFVSEAKNILIENDTPPFEYLPDVSNSLSKSSIEGTVLTIKDIKDILALAVTSRKLFNFLKSRSEETLLQSKFCENLFVDKMFEHHLSSVFNDAGEISDNASKKLKEIRNDINDKSSRLRRVVNKLLKQLSESYLVQDEYVTQRDGRIVVPVKSEHKRHVRGFIHSESATGQTVYIEPEETLELNNEILSLSFAEKREIERILKNLTKIIGEQSYNLRLSLNAVAELDVIFSKAKYSIEVIGSFPSLLENKPLEIINGRHPILVKKLGSKNTIPLNLKVDKNGVILITGPNAGGKTVVLKTVGLLALMVQCGIHIPVDPDSNFHIFNEILIDIGDEQSIEDDLSTFSSHLSNIKKIIAESTNKSLVLVDEIGTGTDPAEGSALATAVLITLNKKGTLTLATTHHGSLKLIAHDLDGFENASMQFDLENLTPTYLFRQGLPGSSYAFEVAERIGFDKEFIQLSKKYLDVDKNKIEDFLVELETKSKTYRDQLNKAEVENARLKGLTNLYQSRVTELEKQKKKILQETKTKADLFLKDVNKKVEQTIKNIKESNAEKSLVKDERKKIEELKITSKELLPAAEEEMAAGDFKLSKGDGVKVRDTNIEGELLDFNESKNKATIISGTMKLQVKFNDLYPQKLKKKNADEYRPVNFEPVIETSTLDIRGYKPEDADYKVIRYIDDAFASNAGRVEILHGKGTGVLRQTVHEILKHHDSVKKYYLADIEFGGEGITIVEFK
ncbi:MAG: endonuclease MutS2 [Ignavibacteriae bacterium]|nr:endonuclease MutS2 [Ignavibacteriota bacterium]NOH00321.1 endonuclease MutS2 [Ignavibacteriota bacterium]